MHALIPVDYHCTIAVELRIIIALRYVLVDPIVLLNEGGILGSVVWLIGMGLHLLMSVAIAIAVKLPLRLVISYFPTLFHLIVTTVFLEAIPV